MNFFLFPHMTLSSNTFRDLCIILPHLNLLEVARGPSIPEWAKGKISGWPVLRNEELSARISSCIDGYRNFAQVHGGPGGILGFLSQAFDEIDEPRYRIQEELRGKCSPDMSPAKREIIQAGLLLEIARQLDEEELEIQSSYSRLSAIEKEFSDILGIDDEAERAETSLTGALAPDTNGLLYMLPRRIESWFRMLSLQPLEDVPVFVACFPEVIEEVVDMARERNGKQFSAAVHSLGSVPRLSGLGEKQLLSLIDAPEISELLTSCHHELEDFITCAVRGQTPAELQNKSQSLQRSFDMLCRKCEMSEGDRVNLDLTIIENATMPDLPGFQGTGPQAGDWPPAFLSIAVR